MSGSGDGGRGARAGERGLPRLRRSIFRRTVMLSFAIVVFLSTVFVSTSIGRQRAMLIRSLEAKAEIVATSIAQVTVTSVVVDAYATVVEHCQNVVAQRPSIRYVVITRKDGFSLVHLSHGWRMDSLDGPLWRPPVEATSRGAFIHSALVTGRVFHYSYPLNYSGIDWGWVHIGLSTDEYDSDLRTLVTNSAAVTLGAVLVGLLASFMFGQSLSTPIRKLDEVTQRVAAGDLTARVELHTGDELERLATSFNHMTAALQGSRAELLASLREKEVLLKEVHHRVKNNLQVISSLLSLQSGYVQDETALSMFRDSQDRVRSMALVHEKLYQSRDLARIDFAEYVADLTRELFRSYSSPGSPVLLSMDIQDAFLGVDVAIPCGLIINELVSNALKHAFPEGREGRVRVGMHRAEGTWVLVVADNGVGLPEGLDVERTDSLGLQLVHTLSRQLDGELGVEVGEGTVFSLTFEPRQPGGRAAGPNADGSDTVSMQGAPAT